LELTPDQGLPLEIDVGVLGASRRARRPGVEPVLPAVYDGSLRQQTLTMSGSPEIRVGHVSQSMSTTPSSRLTCDEPRWTAPCWTLSKCGEARFGDMSPTLICR